MAELENYFEGLNMPYSLDAEQSVLGAIILEPSCISSEEVQQLRPEYFYLPQHQSIYRVMYSMFAVSKPIDAVTLLEELRQSGEYEKAGGKEYLAQLADVVPTVDNIGAYVKVVVEKYYTRLLIRAGRKMIDEAQTGVLPADELIDAAEQSIFDIREGRDVANLVPIKQVITDESKRVSSLIDPEVRKESRGAPTGLSGLDAIIGGMNKSDLWIIGARPGVGKTSFALNIARNSAMAGKKVAFFSLEMSKEQLVQRLISSEGAIESTKLRWKGLENEEEWERFATASANLYKTEIYIDDTAAITVPQMKAKLRRCRPDVVFVDYLQLIEPVNKRSDNRVTQVTEITRSLKIMAKELNVPVIVASQLSRSSVQGKASRAPQLSDLRESGSIEQDADIVLLLYRVDETQVVDDPDAPAPNMAQCIVAKNRHGATGKVDMSWNGQYYRYETIDEDHEY